MKSFLLIIVTALIIGCSAVCQAQPDFVIVSSTTSLENNELFAGVRNDILFYCPFKLNEIKVSGGKIVFSPDDRDSVLNNKVVSRKFWRNIQKQGYFYLIPDCDANKVEVNFIGKKGSINKFFRPIPAPKLITKFVDVRSYDDSINLGALQLGRELGVYFPDRYFILSTPIELIDFKVQTTHSGKTENFSCAGRKLNQEVLKVFSELRRGDRIVIYDVNVTGACGLIHLEDRLDLIVK
jgi:hypothetical protein